MKTFIRITIAVGLLAVFVSLLAGIWLDDSRFFWTALLTLTPIAFLGARLNAIDLEATVDDVPDDGESRVKR